MRRIGHIQALSIADGHEVEGEVGLLHRYPLLVERPLIVVDVDSGSIPIYGRTTGDIPYI